MIVLFPLAQGGTADVNRLDSAYYSPAGITHNVIPVIDCQPAANPVEPPVHVVHVLGGTHKKPPRYIGKPCDSERQF